MRSLEGRTLAALALILAVCCGPKLLLAQTPAGDTHPLYEQEPYDILVLADKNQTQLKVKQLDFPGRIPPTDRKPGTRLKVRRLTDPNNEYEVSWRDIAEIKVFEQLVLEKAVSLVQEKQFAEAYDYFHYIETTWPKLAGLKPAIADFLYKEALDWQKQGSHENALVVLQELRERAPDHPGLEKTLGEVVAALVEKRSAAEDYAGARRMLELLSSPYPQHPEVQRIQAAWAAKAAGLVERGRQDLAANKPREAQFTAAEAMLVWPKAPGASALLNEAYAKYPRVTVGVRSVAVADQNPLWNWGARRTSRLLARQIVEFEGTGAQGGVYRSPIADITRAELGRQLQLQVRTGIPWAGGRSLLGYDVARELVSMTDPASPLYRADWLSVFAGAGVHDVYRVDVDLRRAHVSPEALLQVPLVAVPIESRPSDSLASETSSAGASAAPLQVLGPYTLKDRTGDETTFLERSGYFAATPTQPKEVIEHVYTEGKAAMTDLRKGRIAALDRLDPWDVDAARKLDKVRVIPYSVPTLHCLLPNTAKPFLQLRTFRRALVYGINRSGILKNELLRGKDMAGAMVISGPFPRPVHFDDPRGYAYDDQVEPRPYDPRLAMALAGVARRELSAAAEKAKKPEIKKLPAMVIVHPPTAVARAACEAIQAQLAPLGISVSLREADVATPAALGDYDLLYVELTMQEPLVDARRLLGAEGPTGRSSSYLIQAIEQLDTSANWTEAGERLRRLHQLVHDESSIIPLWQLPEFMAVRDTLVGIPENPVQLYGNIEQWQSRAPAEATP